MVDTDRTPIEELGRGLTALYLEVAPIIADDIRARAVAALREAELQGMMRAAEIARSFHGSGASGKTIAQAIERAAKE